jgi:hypothetical protein
MRKSELFDRCVYAIDKLRTNGRLSLKSIIAEPALGAPCKVCSGISVSTVEGEAGLITRAWGFIFTSPDKPMRCTDIHTSFYGEGVVLDKLWRELEKLS